MGVSLIIFSAGAIRKNKYIKNNKNKMTPKLGRNYLVFGA